MLGKGSSPVALVIGGVNLDVVGLVVIGVGSGAQIQLEILYALAFAKVNVNVNAVCGIISAGNAPRRVPLVIL